MSQRSGPPKTFAHLAQDADPQHHDSSRHRQCKPGRVQRNLNAPTTSARRFAWSRRLSAAALLSSTSAAFCCVM